jgi:hypothetical protein
MLGRAFAAGLPSQWVTGHSVYGDDRRLRLWLELERRAHVLAVSGMEYVWAGLAVLGVPHRYALGGRGSGLGRG